MVLSRAIVELGRALGLEMVVEGVESQAQATWFASLGCQYAQGFLYSRPLEAVRVDEYLAARVGGAGSGASGNPGQRPARPGQPRRRGNLRVVDEPGSESAADSA
jgi:predicted signal transduction protein with EAL and GGDEF domain